MRRVLLLLTLCVAIVAADFQDIDTDDAGVKKAYEIAKDQLKERNSEIDAIELISAQKDDGKNTYKLALVAATGSKTNEWEAIVYVPSNGNINQDSIVVLTKQRDDKPPPAPIGTPPSPNEVPVPPTEGWQPISTNDPWVEEAFKVAKKDLLASLDSDSDVEIKLVEADYVEENEIGSSYRLLMTASIEGQDDGEYVAVVYKPVDSDNMVVTDLDALTPVVPPAEPSPSPPPLAESPPPSPPPSPPLIYLSPPPPTPPAPLIFPFPLLPLAPAPAPFPFLPIRPPVPAPAPAPAPLIAPIVPAPIVAPQNAAFKTGVFGSMLLGIAVVLM